MKYLIVALIWVTIISVPVSAQSRPETEADTCDVKTSNKKLDDAYQKVLAQYASDKAFVKQFELSQKSWFVYRDAQLNALYPAKEPGYYGSVLSNCECLAITRMTSDRIKEINLWLNGTEEGDVCAGSIKRK